MNSTEQQIHDLVRAELKDCYVKPEYKGKVDSRFCGHCHHATIAMYELLGGKGSGYKVKRAVDELEITHYWLEAPNGTIIDPTVEQYTDCGRTPPYDSGCGKASYRRSSPAKEIIEAVKLKLEKK